MNEVCTTFSDSASIASGSPLPGMPGATREFLARLPAVLHALERKQADWSAHLVLVDNPAHHPQGDFTLGSDGIVGAASAGRLTFSGIGAYRPGFFDGIAAGTRKPLGPMLYEAAARGRVYGERFGGRWVDVGTPERLAQLQAVLAGQPDARG